MFTTTFIAAAMTAGSLLSPATTPADHVENLAASVSNTVSQLKAWGYDVMINGLADTDSQDLTSQDQSYCTVTGVHPDVTGPLKPGSFETVYVDLSCPDVL